MKKRRYKMLKYLAVIVLPLLLLLGGLLYLRLYGFERALQELVASKSNGQYALVIESSSVSIRELSFELQGVNINRDLSAPNLGIRSVRVPFVRLRFGSLLSMFQVGQFNIETLVISEPEVEMDAPPKKDSTAQTRINVTEQMLNLYPAIESILERFNIKSFSIQRASVELDKVAHPTLKLGLIDLLIQDWNIKQLTKKSQLQLRIGSQAMDLGKTTLNFAAIEFNFQKHFLRFSNFELQSTDTVTNSDVSVSGSSLLLQHLNYKELYENHRYKLERAEIDSAVVIASIRMDAAGKKKDKKDNKDKDVVARILKQTFGECSIDSTIIRNARVHLSFQKEKDSINIDLPHIDFKLHSFQVIQDSNRFLMGEIEVNLKGTAITLHKNLAIHFNKISFDEYRNLVVTDVKVYNGPSGQKQVAAIGKLQLEYFNLMQFIFYKQFYADAVHVEDADIETDGTVPATGNGSGNGFSLAGLRVPRVTVKNSKINYRDADKTLFAQGLSAEVTNVHLDTARKVKFNIEKIRLRNGLVRHAAEKINSKIRNIDFDGRVLKADHIDLKRDSLSVVLKNILAEAREEVTVKGFHHWKKIELSDVTITGRLQHNKKQPEKKKEHHTLIDEFRIQNLTTNVSTGGNTLVLDAKDFVVNSIVSDESGFHLASVLAKQSSIQVTTPGMHASAQQVRVNYPQSLRADALRVTTNKMDIDVANVLLLGLDHNKGQWQFDKIRTNKVIITKDHEPFLQSDSVLVVGTQLVPNNAPVIERLEIFKPAIVSVHKAIKKADAESSGKAKLPVFNHVIIHPGEARLPDNKVITFGKIDANRIKGTMRCDFIHTYTKKMQIRVNDVALQNAVLTVDSVTLKSRPEWFAINTLEDDVINATLSGISVKGFILDSLMRHQRIKNLDVDLNNFAMNIKRDKRKQDPPQLEKPVTLNGLLRLPANVQVNAVNIKNGTLQYSEVSEKTGEEGTIKLTNLSATLNFDKITSRIKMHASTRLYNAAPIDVSYETLDENTFSLAVRVSNLDMTLLNQMITPLEALKIKSGYLQNYTLDIVADRDNAVGRAAITYKNLHLEIFKKSDVEKKSFGTGLLTFLADGLILKHSKDGATADVNQARIKHKSVFNYWIKSAVHGATNAVRRGKRKNAAKV